jgi:integrase/recombinase XerD
MKHLVLFEPSYIAIHKEFTKYVKNKGYSIGSQYQLPSHVQEFLFKMEEAGITQIKWIEPKHVQSHYQYLSKRPKHRIEGGLSGSMLEHHVYAIRVFFNWLVHLEAIYINPVSGLEFPKSDCYKRVALPHDEIKALFEATENHRDRAILSLYYGCGMRREEGSALNRADIDFGGLRLVVRKGKNNKRREIPLHGSVANYLRDYWRLERPSYVSTHTPDNMKAFLVNNYGNRMSGDWANKRIKFLAQKAEIKNNLTLHVLRHSIATHLKENGMSIEQIKEFLGHSTLDVTQAYIEGYKMKWKKKKYYRNY